MKRAVGRKYVRVAVALLGLGVVAAGVVAADNGVIRVDRDFGVEQPAMFVPDEFIVVLTADARRDAVAGVDHAGAPTVNLPSLQDVIGRNGVSRFARQFPTAQPQVPGSKFHDLTGHYKVKIGPGGNLGAVMSAFARNPNVESVEFIGIHELRYCASGTALTPNDTYYNNPPPEFYYPQWDLWDNYGIDADLAWSLEAGDPTVIVVAMDSGVRYFHKDLGGNDPPGPTDNVTDGNVWVNPYEIPDNGIDDEGNGFIDDVVGWDFVTGVTGCSTGEDCSTPDNDPRDFNGHGTHTAGTMAAITNNARSVAGIAGGFGDGTTGSAGNGSKIMCMRIGWDSPAGGYVRMDFAAQAMSYVADMKTRGVNVAAVNASWGSSNSGGIDAAVDNLLAADVMLIHAAGNSPTGSPDYLGSKAGVMNVAATDQGGYKASFSNYGTWVDIAAPGVDIISTFHHSGDPANDYVAVMDGTSMAAPHVAGVAALLESCDPALSGPDKFNLMVNNGCAANSPNIGDILNAKLALDAAGCGGGFCGDETCGAGEDQCNCPEDCGTPPANEAGLCADGVDNDCDLDVDCDDADCAADPDCICNNNGTCELGEDCYNCPGDCIQGGGTPGCGNGTCEPGEDCNNCPADCREKTTGGPSTRYCCDGDLPDCGNIKCSEDGWSCGSSDSYCCGDSVCEGAETVCNCYDCGDPDPSEIPNSTCFDGIDNDCDTLMDCDDDDCYGIDPNCPTCLPTGAPCDPANDLCCVSCHPKKLTCK